MSPPRGSHRAGRKDVRGAHAPSRVLCSAPPPNTSNCLNPPRKIREFPRNTSRPWKMSHRRGGDGPSPQLPAVLKRLPTRPPKFPQRHRGDLFVEPRTIFPSSSVRCGIPLIPTISPPVVSLRQPRRPFRTGWVLLDNALFQKKAGVAVAAFNRSRREWLPEVPRARP